VTTTEIERHPGSALELSPGQQEWTPRQRAALVQLGLEEATDADLAVFLHQSQRTGLDPFAKQIYMIGRWDKKAQCTKYTIQTGIDGFRVVADRRPQYDGQDDPEWCGPDGVWRDVWTSDKPPTAARVRVYRKDWQRPAVGVALFREYAVTNYDGSLSPMWKSKGALMIAKCAEALAMRKAFPQDLSGIYTPEEMAQADQTEQAPRVIGQRPADPNWASKPATQHERATGQPEPMGMSDDEWAAWIDAAAKRGDVAELQNLWRKAKTERPADLELREHITQVADEVKARQVHPAGDEPPVDEAPAADEPIDADVVADQKQHRHMHALWRKAGVEARDERLAVLSHLVGRAVESSKDLTYAEADQVIQRLQAFDVAGKDALKEAVDRWLGEYHAARPATGDEPDEATS
jgi:phage recombination protein Bet